MNKRTACRVVANTLPIVRAAAGPVIAEKLRHTTPEERSWKFATAVGFITVTDALDGYLSRRAGATKVGAWLDQISDKALVLPVMKALADTGEVSPVHHKLMLARDVVVSGARYAAARRGLNTEAMKLGKHKTELTLATLAVASSPLARQEGLLPAAVFASSALCVASAVELGLGLMNQYEERPNHA